MGVYETLQKVKAENPQWFDKSSGAVNKEDAVEITLSSIPEDLPPSEMKQLADIVKRRRLTAEGLPQDELKNLMRRIGR